MPTPNNSPRRKRGTPIRVATPPVKTAHVHSGKTTFFEPNQIVYTGAERRGEWDRRDVANDRRAEWRNPDSKKNNPKVWGRRASPARQYNPAKYATDRALPKEWFVSFRQEINRFFARVAKHNGITNEQARAKIAKELGPTNHHLGQMFKTKGNSEYLITYNPVDDHFYWSSSRRLHERRKADRRSPLREVSQDPTVN